MSSEDRIKEFARKSGAPLVGIASVEAIDRYAPEGYRPGDLLWGAKSVLIVGGPTNPEGAWRSPTQRITVTNRFFPARGPGVAMRLAEFIQEEYGEYALTYSGLNDIGHVPFLSLKLCAEMAGLGTRVMAAGIILNETYGLISIYGTITTMPLAPDGPLSQSLCPHPSCVKMWDRTLKTPCLEACPSCLSGELEDGKVKWMRYNRHICSTRAQTTSTGAFQRMLLEAINEPDPDKRKMIILGSFFGRAVRSIAMSTEVVGNCAECLRSCPICLRTLSLSNKKAQARVKEVLA